MMPLLITLCKKINNPNFPLKLDRKTNVVKLQLCVYFVETSSVRAITCWSRSALRTKNYYKQSVITILQCCACRAMILTLLRNI